MHTCTDLPTHPYLTVFVQKSAGRMEVCTYFSQEFLESTETQKHTMHCFERKVLECHSVPVFQCVHLIENVNLCTLQFAYTINDRKIVL